MKPIIVSILLMMTGLSFSQVNFELENTANSTEQEQSQLSSDAFYNSGIEYYYKQEFGKAIWAFESALKVNPANKDASINLEIINKELEDYISSEPKGVSSWL